MTVSIKDVARAAGVSPATVSRVLGNGPVSAALREQVEAAIRATGYRPNLSARRLRSQHSQTIGLVVADIRNPFFTSVARAVETVAYDAGMRVILCNTDEDPAREAMYLRLMQEERVTGLIFAPTRVGADTLRRQPVEVPAVLIDRTGPAGLFDAVVLDNRGAAQALVDHLVERGYRRIGGLFGATSSTGLERQEGYLAAMARHGLTPAVRFVPPQAEVSEPAVRDWLGQADRPEALVTSNSLLLAGAVRVARGLGLRIPADLALAGFDNEPWTGLVDPGLTVIEQPTEEMGRQAMQLLFDRLHQPDAAVRTVVLSGRCVLRDSTVARSALAVSAS